MLPTTAFLLSSFVSKFVTRASVVSIRLAMLAAFDEGGLHDLGGVEDAGLDHVDVLAGVGVVADVGAPSG